MITSKAKKALHILLTIHSIAFVFLWLPSENLFELASRFLTIIFIIQLLLPSSSELRKDPSVRLGGLFFLYLIFSIAWHKLTLPESFHTSRARQFLSVLYFIPIAYTINHDKGLTPARLLFTAFAGLLLHLVLSFNPIEWQRAWQGYRVNFGIHNAQHTGIVFATFAIAFSVFSTRFYKWTGQLTMPLKLTALAVWLSALLFSYWGVFVSQTRAVWLALIIASVALPFIILIAQRLRRHTNPPGKKMLLGGLTLIATLTLTAYSFDIPEIISSRLAAEKVTMESLHLAASHETKNLGSIEVRVATWSAATEWIMDRPLLGWGGRGQKQLIQDSEYFSDNFKVRFGHLHNSYLESLVRIGFMGAGLIFILAFILGKRNIACYRRGSMPTDIFIFTWLFFIFWLIVNIFESYIIYPSGIYLMNIVAALSYSYSITSQTIYKRS